MPRINRAEAARFAGPLTHFAADNFGLFAAWMRRQAPGMSDAMVAEILADVHELTAPDCGPLHLPDPAAAAWSERASEILTPAEVAEIWDRAQREP